MAFFQTRLNTLNALSCVLYIFRTTEIPYKAVMSSSVLPSATGSGYRVLIGFHRDRCDFRDLSYRSSAGCGQIWD